MKATENPAAVPQPAPVTNESESMHDLVIADLRACNAHGLIEDLVARKTFGLQKYGTVLQAFNGRDALMDAYQETLDQLVYLKQELTEHPEDRFLDHLYSKALKIAYQLRRRIEAR